MDILNPDGSVIENGADDEIKKVVVVLSGQATDDQISQWKTKNPRGIWELIGGGKIGYVRKPTRDEMKSVATMGQTDPIGQVETLLTDSWLGGDKDILEDEDLFMGASHAYRDLLSFATFDLKKL